MKAVLIVNPAAGRAAQVAAGLNGLREALLQACREYGWEAGFVETGPEAGSAERLARAAVKTGARLVIACGGDGTVHGVLQGVAQTEAMLGVLPFGTANALARNLHLPMDPLAAMHRLMGCRAQTIPLGWVDTAEGGRWFAVMAGAGPDGMLVESGASLARGKARFGRSAYYGRAFRLFATRRFPVFRVEYRLHGAEGDGWQACEAVGVMAARVPNLGGLFRGLTAQSRLHHPYLQVQIVRAPARLSLATWFATTHLRVARWNPLVRSLQVRELRCTALGGGTGPPVQVDGEPAGALPVRMRVVPDALRLLAPAWAHNTLNDGRARLRSGLQTDF